MKPRNVLLICSDEHARSALGCYGHPVARTPVLDQLAGTGVRFTRAYTPSPICIPARASLATGTQVHENRCWSSAEPYHGQLESWMHRLRGQDHAVVSIGKLHFRSGADDNGFSEEIAPMYLANDGKGWPQGLLRSPMTDFPDAADMAIEIGSGDTSYTDYDREITDEACRWLRHYPKKISNKPWCLFASFVSPHFPLQAPEKFYSLYEGSKLPAMIGRGERERPPHPIVDQMARFWNYDDYFDEETRDIARRGYFGLCSFLDDNIRQVMMALEDSGAAQDTVVIYISDHGEMLGNHGFWAKSVMYEDSVGVPLIMTGPGIAHGVNDTPVSLTDIAATVEDITGALAGKPQGAWQSHSLQQVIDQPMDDRFIFSEYHDGGSPTGFFMIRQGAWKYVYYAGGHPVQLFNLDDDPDELNDLGEAARFEDKAAELHGLLTEILDPEEVNRRAFADQAAVIEKFGGVDKVRGMPSFNHTPIGS
ncbi:MAG: sulfatase-like hydrolase/transferase [Rhizobiales bacterium]|nr:sulfatase-like hydrolase/transferase [Hyphomicrobiales bacterium]